MSKGSLVGGLSLMERCKLFVGKNSWEMEPINNRIIRFSDGPCGLRKEIIMDGRIQMAKAISYPAPALMASTFNKRLMNKLGRSLALECIKNRVDILLAPGVNIKRNPLCGRSFEYFSEDPYLSGVMGGMYIKGLQEENVGASLKHYALNNKEEGRFISDSIADERALREIYLKPFELAIKIGKPWTVMTSYNKVNGVHATENKHLLKDILRNDFKYDGVVLTDWGAINNPVESLKAGVDLEMPGLSKGSSEAIYNEIKNGRLDGDILEESTNRLINLYLNVKKEKRQDFDYNKGLELAKRINEEGIVLLKNNNNILPLKRTDKIALIGEFAKKPRFQGGGSSRVNPIYLGNLCDELLSENLHFSYTAGYDDDVKVNESLIKAAVEAAKIADKAIIVCGLPKGYESEGYDRDNMRLPITHLRLIDEVARVNKNVIVILENGSPVEMPFIDKVDGLIEAYLGGGMQAMALKNILLGITNPSGRLAESFPISYSDCISSQSFNESKYYSLYRESIYVGYRYYDTFNIPVLFPFGYGLSYSEVEYSKISCEIKGDEIITSFRLKNKSKLPTKEVVELYVGLPGSKIYRARKELKEFQKVSLKPYEEKDYELSIKIDSLRYYSIPDKKYILEDGVYRIYLGKSVADESNYFDLKIASEDIAVPFGSDVYYNMTYLPTNEDFFSLLDYTPRLIHKARPFTIDSPLSDFNYSLRGFFILKIIKYVALKDIDDDELKRMVKESLELQPIRSIQAVSDISKRKIQAIVDFFNWHLIRAIRGLK